MSTFLSILKIIIGITVGYFLIAGILNIDYSNMNSSDYLLTIIALTTLGAIFNAIDNG
jgi:hypothetical protein